MATTAINNKPVQCHLVFKKQTEGGDLKLLQEVKICAISTIYHSATCIHQQKIQSKCNHRKY